MIKEKLSRYRRAQALYFENGTYVVYCDWSLIQSYQQYDLSTYRALRYNLYWPDDKQD